MIPIYHEIYIYKCNARSCNLMPRDPGHIIKYEHREMHKSYMPSVKV